MLQRAVADTGLWPVTSAVDVPWGVNLLMNLVAGLLVAAGLYLVLRSPRQVPARSDADETQLRDLIAGHGARDSLGYFALRRDKNVIFSPTGKAAVSYRVIGGVSLAAGDPARRPRGVARGDRRLAGTSRTARLALRGARRQRLGRRRLPASRRPPRAGARRRGGRRGRPV